jgi:pilus assembly protein CpaB
MAAIGQTKQATATNMRTPIFIGGVGLALIAFLLMFAFGLLFARGTQAGAPVSVVVAKDTINAREPIDPGMLTVKSLPASAVPPQAFLRVNQLTGYSALVDIPVGQAITANIVSANQDLITPSTFLPVPEGYVALTIPTSEQQGVAGYPAQGDYIDIIATVNTQLFTPVNPRSVTGTVFTQVYVLRVGPQSTLPRQGQPQGVTSSLTVVMTLCDSQYLNWLILNATLKYALLSYHDYGKAQPQPDPNCPSTKAPAIIGPSQVNARYGFLRG